MGFGLGATLRAVYKIFVRSLHSVTGQKYRKIKRLFAPSSAAILWTMENKQKIKIGRAFWLMVLRN